jgi:phage tail-like protein
VSHGFEFCGNFNFLVEIEDFDADAASVVGGFAEVDGISSASSVLEYRVGSQPVAAKIPGALRFGNIVLKRGVTTSTALHDWRRNIERGERDVRSGSIILLDTAMAERTRWNFYGAWPCRYEAPKLDAEGEGIGIELIELCVERIERIDPVAATAAG